MTKKSKLIGSAVAVGLAAVVGIGATLAYFTDTTSTVTNTFTVGDVDITLTEPKWDPDDAKNLYPGAEISKNPMITNTGSGDAYVAITVDGMKEMADAGFSAVVDSTNWVKVDANGVVDGEWATDAKGQKLLEDGIYAYIGTDGILAAGKNTSALFEKVVYATETENVTVNVVGHFVKKSDNSLVNKADVEEGKVKATDLVTNEDGSYKLKYTIGEGTTQYDSYADAEKAIRADKNIISNISFDLDITGYAIQTTEVTYKDASNAYVFVKELIKTNNN